jgi:ankyrin repeat protein
MEEKEVVTREDIIPLMRLASDARKLNHLAELLSTGNCRAQLFVKDDNGRTALDWARLTRNNKATALLVEAMGKEINESRAAILNNKTEVNVKTIDGNMIESKRLLRCLHAQDEEGAMSVMIDSVVYRDQVENLGAIFFIDLPDENDNARRTPLMIAAGNNMIKCVHSMIERGASLDDGDKYGNSALTWTSACGHGDIVRTLLFRGANIHHTTKEGRTALHYACLHSKPRVAAILFNFMYERFSTYRNKHPKSKFDPTRWTKYATMLENYAFKFDNEGLRPHDLIPKARDAPAGADSAGPDLQYVQPFPSLGGGDSLTTLTLDPMSDIEAAKSLESSKPSVSPIPLPLPPNEANSLNIYTEMQPQDGHGTTHAGSQEYVTDMRRQVSEQPGDNISLSEVGSETGSVGGNLSALNMSNANKNRGVFYTGEENMSMVSDSVGHRPDFSYDTDDIIGGLHGLEGSISVMDSLAVYEEQEALRKIFLSVQDRLFTWRRGAGVEAQLGENVPCPLCGKLGRVEELTVHVKNECEKRLIRCEQCTQMFTAAELGHHKVKLCPKRTIACPNSTHGCLEMVYYENLDQHLSLKCKVRSVECRLGCGAHCATQDREGHEQDHCKLREIKCYQCKDTIIAKNLGEHLHDECPERSVRCPVSCGIYHKGKDIDEHVNVHCLAPCKWGCGEVVGPLQRKNVHELMLCKLRPQPCQECGAKGITKQYIKEHIKYQCPESLVRCPSGCGQLTKRNDLSNHRDPWKGTCSERLVRCPSNLIGWRVQVSGGTIGTVLMYERVAVPKIQSDGTDDSIQSVRHRKREESGQKKTVEITPNWSNEGIDKLYIRFPNKHEWIDLWQTDFLLLNKTQEMGIKNEIHKNCLFDCEWLLARDLNEHLSSACVHRKMRVPGTSFGEDNTVDSSWVGEAKDLPSLMKSRDNFLDFSKDTRKKTACEYCSEEMPEEDIQLHIRNVCTKVVVRCAFGCGLKVLRGDMNYHTSSGCPKRTVVCVKCSAELWAEELEDHELNSCSNRPAECQLNCGTKDLTAESEEAHRINACPLRLIKCRCGKDIPFEDLSNHMIADCPKKLGKCPQGCGADIARDSIQHHMDHECPNQTAWGLKYRQCPLGCGGRYMRKDMLVHVSYKCKLRLVDCPQHCGNIIKHDKLPIHLHYCPMALIGCDPSQTPCERALHKWFFKREIYENDDGSLGSLTLTPRSYHENGNNEENSTGGSTVASKMTYPVPMAKAGRDDNSLLESSIFTNNSTTQLANGDEYHTPGHFMSGGEIWIKDDVNMCKCQQHSSTILMYAIKKYDLLLLDYVLRVTAGQDIDHQNIYGETALTMACAQGKKACVELLLQAGADLNMETSSGRTAIIEAVKCNPPNLDLTSMLVESGALCRERTRKHRKSASDWAHLLNLKYHKRVLELGGIIQAQERELFIHIATGNLEAIKEIVAGGDFFTPTNSQRLLVGTNTILDQRDKVNDEARMVHERLGAANEQIGVREAKFKELLRESLLAEETKIAKEKILHATEQRIQDAVTIFEGSYGSLHESDLDELFRMRKPGMTIRFAVLIYGTMYGILPLEGVYNVDSVDELMKWWPTVLGAMKNRSRAIKRLKGFSLDKLKGPYGERLLAKVREIFDKLVLAEPSYAAVIETDKFESSASRVPSSSASRNNLNGGIKMSQNADNPQDSDVGPSRETRLALIKSDGPGEMKSRALVKEDIAEDSSTDDSEPELTDADWDSDADDAGTGHWHKGEWVPLQRKTEKWWDKEERKKLRKANKKKIEELSKSKPLSRKEKKIVVNLVGKLSENGMSENKGAVHELQQSRSSTSSKPSENRTSEEGTEEKEENLHLVEHYEPRRQNAGALSGNGGQFIETMLKLVKAAEKYAQSQIPLEEARNEAFNARTACDEARQITQEAKMEVEGATIARTSVEFELADRIKESKFLLRKAQDIRSKLRVAKLLNVVSMSGHTALTWAASHGFYEAAEELLTHGSSVGFNEELYHLNASVIQTTYRLYLLIKKENQNVAQSGFDAVTAMTNTHSIAGSLVDTASAELAHQEQDDNFYAGPTAMQITLEKIFILKDARQRKLIRARYCRNKIRNAMCEAAYSAKWEICQRIWDRGLYHHTFQFQWVYPQGPTPRPMKKHRIKSKELPFDMLTCLAFGMSDLAAGDYVVPGGWIGPNDEREPYGISHVKLEAIRDKAARKAQDDRNTKLRLRLLLREKKRLIEGRKRMRKAIFERDWYKCIELAESGACSIDEEMDNGQTALLAAAEEDAGALNHRMMLNTDENPVLAIEFLLDRQRFRASINQENKFGQSALMRACVLGRSHTAQALLDRKADPSFRNSHGQTALHFAASVGSTPCVRMLLERGVKPFYKDLKGKTAYDICYETGFTKCMSLISQFTGGFLGDVTATRGNVEDYVRCPHACGVTLFKYEVNVHVKECINRVIQCPHGCGVNHLLAKELEEHVRDECPCFPGPCPDCNEPVKRAYMQDHLDNECSHRRVLCTLGCPFQIKFFEMPKHHRFCRERFIVCNLCDQEIRNSAMPNHSNNECPKRRILCPLLCGSYVVAQFIDDHLAKLCSCRPLPCKWCGVSIKEKEKKFHEKGCARHQIQCPFACGEFPASEDLAAHKAACLHRFVECPSKCDTTMKYRELEHHLAHECSERLVLCEFGCFSDAVSRAVTRLPAKLMPLHLQYECPLRKKVCNLCGEKVLDQDVSRHNESLCPERPVQCRNNRCGKELPLSRRLDHEESRCRFRTIICYQGCNLEVVAIDMNCHMNNLCSMRYLNCTLGCGERMRWKDMREHQDTSCARRDAHNKKGR